ncbi:MAG: hypothetical protein KBC44_00125 [Candidatus Pacebacteria bacterium]|nr:hypothetical protein [Candidatus Paceibacterota bacterium]MBP9839373.1 hypothetical protein [Candidatus Paceibacterota bacterium]
MNSNEILNLIREILSKLGLEDSNVAIQEETSLGKDNALWFAVESPSSYAFLGRGGEALFAFNHLVKKIVENKTKEEDRENLPEFIIDINGFQKKRIENLHAIAHMMAERARYFKSSVEIDPMPAFERRIVHEFLSNEQDLKTESEGTGPNRRVVIKYLGSI